MTDWLEITQNLKATLKTLETLGKDGETEIPISAQNLISKIQAELDNHW